MLLVRHIMPHSAAYYDWLEMYQPDVSVPRAADSLRAGKPISEAMAASITAEESRSSRGASRKTIIIEPSSTRVKRQLYQFRSVAVPCA
jgi:hypothetical protein